MDSQGLEPQHSWGWGVWNPNTRGRGGLGPWHTSGWGGRALAHCRDRLEVVLKPLAKHTQVTVGGRLERAVWGQGPLSLIHEVTITTAWPLAISFLSHPDPWAMPQGPHPHPASSLGKGERAAVGDNHVLRCLIPPLSFLKSYPKNTHLLLN